MPDSDYRPGDHYILDDRTGLKIRKSESVKEWKGTIVHRDVAEERHPQEFVRGLHDKQSVPNARPEPPPVFVGPVATATTAAASAGATTILVESTSGFNAGHLIAIFLANGDRFLATVQAVTDGTHLILLTPLPWAVDLGGVVIDQSDADEVAAMLAESGFDLLTEDGLILGLE